MRFLEEMLGGVLLGRCRRERRISVGRVMTALREERVCDHQDVSLMAFDVSPVVDEDLIVPARCQGPWNKFPPDNAYSPPLLLVEVCWLTSA